jgi:alpha/beta superfamily hydrolase
MITEQCRAQPTFIVCSSNAMFYQQMVLASHSFYLKFFLDRGINVFTWNYRGYGRSKGH